MIPDSAGFPFCQMGLLGLDGEYIFGVADVGTLVSITSPVDMVNPPLGNDFFLFVSTIFNLSLV